MAPIRWPAPADVAAGLLKRGDSPDEARSKAGLAFTIISGVAGAVTIGVAVYKVGAWGRRKWAARGKTAPADPSPPPSAPPNQVYLVTLAPPPPAHVRPGDEREAGPASNLPRLAGPAADADADAAAAAGSGSARAPAPATAAPGLAASPPPVNITQLSGPPAPGPNLSLRDFAAAANAAADAADAAHA